MRIYYGKRISVPKVCSGCGRKSYEKPKINSILTLQVLNKLVEEYWGCYYIALEKKRPGWNIPSWYGECLTCEVNRQLNEKSIFQRIAENPKKEYIVDIIPLNIASI